MPFYNFENTKTGEVWTTEMTNAERETFLENNPDIIQTLQAISTVDPYTVGRLKTDGGWNEMLGRIKKGNRKSTIDAGNITMV